MLSSLTGGGGLSSSTSSGVTSSVNNETNAGNITLGDFFAGNGSKTESNTAMMYGALAVVALLGLSYLKKKK